ncbi:hypothetical protein G7009_01030 [Pseudomonas capeferrum]|uniref:hypothetical protein n=1 Tax=Pseudomonas capeferrum TaxID=1495066 RepID=UPI0015E47777|nr:hypothetical protein [Pseudomonas capeferrum]MBA1200385.1 hypothetical protein [Pseudomonas capeferrum]
MKSVFFIFITVLTQGFEVQFPHAQEHKKPIFRKRPATARQLLASMLGEEASDTGDGFASLLQLVDHPRSSTFAPAHQSRRK